MAHSATNQFVLLTLFASISCSGCSEQPTPATASVAASPADRAQEGAPTDAAIKEFIKQELPAFDIVALDRADFVSGAEGRVSVKASLVLREPLYTSIDYFKILQLNGLARKDVDAVPDQRQFIASRTFFEEAAPIGTMVEVRGEILCQRSIDGWNLFGKIQLDRKLVGEPRAKLPERALVITDPEARTFFAAVKRAKQQETDLIASLEKDKDVRIAALGQILKEGGTLSGIAGRSKPFRITFTEDLHHERDAQGVIRFWIHGNIEWPEGVHRISASGRHDLSKNPNGFIRGSCYYRLHNKSIQCELHLQEWDPGFNEYTGSHRPFLFDGVHFDESNSGYSQLAP